MAPRGAGLFAVLAGAASWAIVAALGLVNAMTGAEAPFPGAGLLVFGVGAGAMALIAVATWREARRRDPPE
jgi:hypothetical protein